MYVIGKGVLICTRLYSSNIVYICDINVCLYVYYITTNITTTTTNITTTTTTANITSTATTTGNECIRLSKVSAEVTCS